MLMTLQITLPFFPMWMKEMRLVSSFCYNEQDFKEVMVNIGQGKRSDRLPRIQVTCFRQVPGLREDGDRPHIDRRCCDQGYR
jgi:hypothetical protein